MLRLDGPALPGLVVLLEMPVDLEARQNLLRRPERDIKFSRGKKNARRRRFRFSRGVTVFDGLAVVLRLLGVVRAGAVAQA